MSETINAIAKDHSVGRLAGKHGRHFGITEGFKCSYLADILHLITWKTMLILQWKPP